MPAAAEMSSNPVLPLPTNGSSGEGFQKLASHFRSKFTKSPEFYVRCPGRVNLIGEHIDYCGYAVFPMAIDQDIVIAVGTNDEKKLRFTDIESKYEDVSFDLSDIKIEKSKPKWFNYLLCGYKGVTEHLKLERLPKGLNLAVSGTIPPSAGLSSSSALVCAGALVTMHSSGQKISKEDMATLCAKCEQYVGTEGGGMDQAICLLAELGSAKLIEFNPLRTTNVQLPDGAAFVIANSLSELNKAATSDYNTRVVECRMGAQIIAKSQGIDWKNIRRLGELQKALGLDLERMAQLVKDTLHEGTYTKSEISKILEITNEQLNELSLSANTTHLNEFNLRNRALHVYTEAHRVLEFKRICEENPKDALKKLGELMDASHASCRDLYECSHPCLDELCKVSKNAGALGARLTGAGWGGCTVSLVPKDRVQNHMGEVKKHFYDIDEVRKTRTATSLFPTQPGGGAVIYTA